MACPEGPETWWRFKIGTPERRAYDLVNHWASHHDDEARGDWSQVPVEAFPELTRLVAEEIEGHDKFVAAMTRAVVAEGQKLVQPPLEGV